MNPREFTHYIGQTSHLASLSVKEASARERLFQLIEKEKNKYQQSFPFHNFFKAEQSFYRGQYEQALKLYLEAKGVPQYQFFCYRATAYIQIAQGDIGKAENYAQKALEVNPNDFPTLQILELIHKPGNQTGPCQIPTPLTENKTALQNEAESIPKISLGEKEIEELASIFESNAEDQEELFAFESSSYQNYAEKEKTPTGSFNNLKASAGCLMNTETEIFSNPKTNDPATTAVLTQRLYCTPEIEEKQPIFTGPQKNIGIPPLEEHKKLGLATDICTALEQRVRGFQKAQNEMIQNYLELYNKRTAIPDHFFSVLHGWHFQPSDNFNTGLPMLTERSRKSSGGFFLRWNGKGIAINPGLHFLDNFHKQGLHIKDIDFVIVTRDNPEAYADVREIYELNAQFNKIASELQIIHYYFNQKAYQELSPILKPHFKQERNALHRLLLFVDSPDVEKIDLGNGIILGYFPVTNHEAFYQNHDRDGRNALAHSCLGIRLELKSSQDKPQGSLTERPILRFGYVSGAAWSPLLSHHLGNCDLLVAGFGNTNASDYSKIKYSDDGLGFFGTFSLMEEIAPRLLLCCEFSGREGDIRIEAVKKMREEYTKSTRSSRTTPVVLPGDDGLFVDLKSLQVRCSISKALVDPAQVRVAKTMDSYGKLQYMSPECLS